MQSSHLIAVFFAASMPFSLWAQPILNPVLNQDLGPPRVTMCVAAQIAAAAPELRGSWQFFGPGFADSGHSGVVFDGRRPQHGEAWHLTFVATGGRRFRLFQDPEGRLGAFGPEMAESAGLTSPDGGPAYAIDLEPCRRLLGR